MERHRLIVGLGNPGLKYEGTRHNLGYEVVRAFAHRQGWSFKKERRFKGESAQGSAQGLQMHLLLPTTYMNLSGEAVQKAVHYYKIPFEQGDSLLVVVDDVYLELGALRLRPRGSAGGHNGLKNIEERLASQDYPRLRVGVGPEKEKDVVNGNLENYVLGPFTAKERERLPTVIERGVEVITCWLFQGLEPAMQLAGEYKKKVNEEL